MGSRACVCVQERERGRHEGKGQGRGWQAEAHAHPHEHHPPERARPHRTLRGRTSCSAPRGACTARPRRPRRPRPRPLGPRRPRPPRSRTARRRSCLGMWCVRGWAGVGRRPGGRGQVLLRGWGRCLVAWKVHVHSNGGERCFGAGGGWGQASVRTTTHSYCATATGHHEPHDLGQAQRRVLGWAWAWRVGRPAHLPGPRRLRCCAPPAGSRRAARTASVVGFKHSGCVGGWVRRVRRVGEEGG